MSDLNAQSDRMVLIIGCSVKNTNKFKKWSKDRAAKYVYDLKTRLDYMMTVVSINIFHVQSYSC